MFQTSCAVALPKTNSALQCNISNRSEIYCHCIYIFDFVIVFVIKPNNLELILRHPASPLNNNVPRKSRVALLSSIWRRIPNRARSYFLEYIILTCANKITTHLSCSCRNEGQRLDAFQICYLCDALSYKKAMSENKTFLNIKLKYTSQL